MSVRHPAPALMHRLGAWVRALRIHQWSKNGLLLLPILAAHLRWDAALGLQVLQALATFSATASAVYLLNDLVDRTHDRNHPKKRFRPIAAGVVSPSVAIVTAILLVVLAGWASWRLPMAFRLTVAGYAALSMLYSLVLKRRIILDVITLAVLYGVRVFAGATVVGIELSGWFLAFSVFFFLSLALVKRVIELRGQPVATEGAVAGRGYRSDDLPILTALGVNATMVAALVYCLYVTSPQVTVMYQRPDLLWLGLPLLVYWQGRMWLLTQRDRVDPDPVLFALRDRMSYLVLAAFLLVVWLAS